MAARAPKWLRNVGNKLKKAANKAKQVGEQMGENVADIPHGKLSGDGGDSV